MKKILIKSILALSMVFSAQLIAYESVNKETTLKYLKEVLYPSIGHPSERVHELMFQGNWTYEAKRNELETQGYLDNLALDGINGVQMELNYARGSHTMKWGTFSIFDYTITKMMAKPLRSYNYGMPFTEKGSVDFKIILDTSDGLIEHVETFNYDKGFLGSFAVVILSKDQIVVFPLYK